jgi:hypothetical protein
MRFLPSRVVMVDRKHTIRARQLVLRLSEPFNFGGSFLDKEID